MVYSTDQCRSRLVPFFEYSHRAALMPGSTVLLLVHLSIGNWVYSLQRNCSYTYCTVQQLREFLELHRHTLFQ